MSYERLLQIGDLDFCGKRVLLVGGGRMAGEYRKALGALGVEDICVISNTEKTAMRWRSEYGVEAFWGGYEKALDEVANPFDLVIVATPYDELAPAAVKAVECGNKNILVEKPGSLYSSILEKWCGEIAADVRIRVGYNRLFYPNLRKVKDLIAADGEKITSCRYTFTEWVHTIDFNNNRPYCYQRWGIINSLHVISMAHWLTGMPVELSAMKSGGFSWHEAGSQFAGVGKTDQDVLFSYHANWESAGRWGIEVMTDSCAYRLMPLEKLFRCEKGSVEWKAVEFECAFADCKMGVAEELAVMLLPELEEEIGLPTVEDAVRFTKLAEVIFGYSCARSEKVPGT